MLGAVPVNGPVDARWQQVTCAGCGRQYQCTPEADYYGSTTLSDGLCTRCFLAVNGMNPETTPVLAVDLSGQEIDPRHLATQEAYEEWSGR
jgi:hypothetical protein